MRRRGEGRTGAGLMLDAWAEIARREKENLPPSHHITHQRRTKERDKRRKTANERNIPNQFLRLFFFPSLPLLHSLRLASRSSSEGKRDRQGRQREGEEERECIECIAKVAREARELISFVSPFAFASSSPAVAAVAVVVSKLNLSASLSCSFAAVVSLLVTLILCLLFPLRLSHLPLFYSFRFHLFKTRMSLPSQTATPLDPASLALSCE